MSSRLHLAEMIGDRFLPSPEGPTLLLTASDDRHDDDIQTAETGDAYGAHDYHDDLPSPRWRDRLVIVIAVIALAGLGAMGAFAYRAVFAGTVMPALPPIIKAENAPNENVPNYGNDRPSDLSQTSIASAGSSEEFVSRWSADIQEPPKTAPISPNPSASPPSAPGSGAVAPIATAPAAPPLSTALTATSLPPKVAAPVPAPSSSTPKKIQTVISRSDGSGQTDTSAATAKSPTAKPSAAAPAPDAAARAPEAKQTAAAAPPVGRPLSLAPDAHGHSAALPPSRSRMPAGTGPAAEASSGGGYAVAVASERSAADAEAVFRSLQAKFPNQLGGREPIVRRTDLGPEGIYYRASIGPFVSMKAAAGVCSSLKAAGESCLVEKN
jgi:SPOR domain